MSFIDFTELARARAQADVLFDLGMKYANECAGDLDLVAAHKWFNLAAMRGNREAVRCRGEIAAEMSEAEIAAAQRAARTWLQEIGRQESGIRCKESAVERRVPGVRNADS